MRKRGQLLKQEDEEDDESQRRIKKWREAIVILTDAALLYAHRSASMYHKGQPRPARAGSFMLLAPVADTGSERERERERKEGRAAGEQR